MHIVALHHIASYLATMHAWDASFHTSIQVVLGIIVAIATIESNIYRL